MIAAILAIGVIGYFGYRSLGSKDILAVSSGDTAKTTFEQELAVPGPLGDMTMGNKNAPLIVYEYASLTCTHCAAFYKETFPEFKKNYIDTGKAYYVLRDFPFDPVATAAFMLAHCAGPDRYFGFIEVLFARQEQWAFVDTPMEALKALARQGGFSEEKFDACMKDQKIFNHVKTVAQNGAQEFGVRSTPTFFINGEKVEGAVDYKDFDAVLKKHLPGGDATTAAPVSDGASTPASKSQ